MILIELKDNDNCYIDDRVIEMKTLTDEISYIVDILDENEKKNILKEYNAYSIEIKLINDNNECILYSKLTI